MRTVLLLVFGLFLMGATTSAGGLPMPYPPGAMPANLAAYALAAEPDYATAKLATLRVETPHLICSATAIGPHKVLTAAHCLERGTDGWRLNTRSATILKVDLDGNDHAILTTDLYFSHTAKFGRKPLQGDVVFSYGNPATTPDMLLIGRVAGWVDDYQGFKDVMLLDRNDWYGCSGAAVFDRNGLIVGVVNALYPWPSKGWRLSAVFKLAFTAEQLA